VVDALWRRSAAAATIKNYLGATSMNIYRRLNGQSFTYDHRTLKTRLPVRSALFKQRTGGLVVRWVTTSEYPLLYVFASFCSAHEEHAPRDHRQRPSRNKPFACDTTPWLSGRLSLFGLRWSSPILSRVSFQAGQRQQWIQPTNPTLS
jgi:hypothetical protein